MSEARPIREILTNGSAIVRLRGVGTEQHDEPMVHLDANIRDVLERAHSPAPALTASERAAIEPLATARVPVRPAREQEIARSLATLSAALPSATSGVDAGRLKLAAYQSMLAGCDLDALHYACRRCLAELDWFPTIRQLLERIRAYVSDEQHAINQARYLLRFADVTLSMEDAPPLTDAEIAGMSPEMARLGIKCGALTQEQVDRARAAIAE
jgi:hypothetical protein